MADYIANLIRKASGSSAMLKQMPIPKPSLGLFYENTISKRDSSQVGSFPESASISKRNPFSTKGKTGEMSPAITSASSAFSERTHIETEMKSIDNKEADSMPFTPEIESTTGDSFTSYTAEVNQKEVGLSVPIDDSKAHFTQPKPEGDTIFKNLDSNRLSINANRSLKSVFGKTNMPDEDSVWESQESGEGIPIDRLDAIKLSTRDSRNISPELSAKDSALEKSVSEIINIKYPIEMNQETSSPTLADTERVVSIEPETYAYRQAVIDDLLAKSKNSASSASTKRDNNKTTGTQSQKEVRVNIGSIEIKASQEDVMDAPPPPQGFDDFLLTRNYLDRRYF